MQFQDLIPQLEASAELPARAQALDRQTADALVHYLKAEADRHWWINANRSLELADLIVRIGLARGDTCQVALGTMARGDALKLLGRTEEAWDTLGHAGDLFLQCGEEIGWARTRIGRLFICVDLNRVPEALNDAKHAREILTRQGVHEKRLILDLNTAIVYNQLGDQLQALSLYQLALDTAEALGEAGQTWLGPLYTNIGNVHFLLGDFRQAAEYHNRAYVLFSERAETSNLATAELNLARIAIAHGRYRRALSLLHHAHTLMLEEEMPVEAAHVKRHMVECYIQLNRYAEARDLAQETCADFHSFGAAYEEALTLLHLAAAEAELGCFPAAQAALDAAEPIFASLGAATWVATTRLRRGRIALGQGDSGSARQEAIAAAASFQAERQQVDYATAIQLFGQACLAENDLASAAEAGETALRIARRSNVPALRYTTHLLLGRAAEAQGALRHATRRYRAAAATVERVQRGLTITLRPGFLEDKGDALQALLALQLRSGAAVQAFETLERTKSQALLNYLANREQLRWAADDPRSQALIDELDRLRAEHQWLYRLAHELAPTDLAAAPLMPAQAQAEIATRERRMRVITEQLYLQSGERSAATAVTAPSLENVRQYLAEDTLMIEFYTDGTNLWAFSLDTHGLQVDRLPAQIKSIDQLLSQLRLNLGGALKAGPQAPATRALATLARRMLQRLYDLLLRPLEPRMRGHSRLVIVPYGSLHYLPFHLLYTGAGYLIERHEVVILPAAGLATRQAPARPSGALILAHSWDGRLPQTRAEARIVQQLFGGDAYYDGGARRTALRAAPTQVLHIVAHGEHRLDQPELSYIQLADGQLYTDDLLQHDLSYELVTLSACETGRATIAAGDELIGLGRGVLYAGAGALLVSLWRVADVLTVGLMEQFYRELCAGASKAAALRAAQCAVLCADPRSHPAFWGAFQLVGDAGPLSVDSIALREKEYNNVRIAASA
ncbi:MAG TPA: CHAT domain-containing tetratricopeptide repeat protein [Roseiflexaceae bacterium]|nr:CHAT domain-containing tetratricopeptide repeat protein [Roseiflexaceae bacterium]